jgi:DNA-binding LytR/AlgR family response regulator
MDNRLQHLIDYIRQYSFSLKGSLEGQNYNISLENILYIDSVDGKTFLYCKEKIFESKETLTSLEQYLFSTPFVRISKSCIMNTNALKSVRILMNHRMEANLINGEKLIITRNYMENVKRKLEK